MASLIKYPNTVSQTTGGSYVSWTDLSNIKNNTTGSWAVSSVLIKNKSQSPNRPSTITCTNFGFNLPVGAEPTKVVITYRHEKVAGSDYSSAHPGRICNIPAPTISLVGVNGFSSKGVAPSTTMASHTKTFKANLLDNKNLDYKASVNVKLTREDVNSSSFGVKINYPKNSGSYNGYMRVSFVRVEVQYKVPSYTVSVKKVSGGYNKEDFVVQLSISNKAGTKYNPRLTLSSPVGFSYEGCTGAGTLTQNSARSFTWNPSLTGKKGTVSLNVRFLADVTYPSGSSSYTGTFTLSENLNSTTSSYSATITDRPVTEDESEGSQILPDGGEAPVTEETVINVVAGNDFVLGLDDIIGDNYPNVTNVIIDFQAIMSTDVSYDGDYAQTGSIIGSGYDWYYEFDSSDLPINGNWTLTPPKKIKVELEYTYTYNGDSIINFVTFYINVIPPEGDLTIPFLSILEPSEEELDRLGSGYTYICQSDIKHTTSDTNARDWYKNNRIGIFNNAIADNITIEDDTITDTTDYDNLTNSEIFENAEYWAENTAGLNDYSSVECEFVYNENYPLYILMTGDYEEATTYGFDIGTVKYNNPCIIEKSAYNGREETGNYFFPIESLITDNETSEARIQELKTTTPVICYDFPLDDNTGNTEDIHIRGIEITGDIEQTDELILYAKLINPDGIIGQRSLVLSDNDNSFKLGGLGDNWGFSQSEIYNIEDWELQLTISNLLGEGEYSINTGDIQLTLYSERKVKQDINIVVEDEDLSFYGAFIEDAKIPEGLETDTSFLTIDGTDTNDAYRQNIREKTIELEISIDGCDLQTSTDMLRQLTKLLVNKKDEYNRPIPNRIEFSHYPDVYFEYIMEDALDVTTNAGAYNIKAKLTVPSGTAYSKESVTTNMNGYVQGLAAVAPIITLSPSDSTVEVKEEVSGQSFKISYPNDWSGKIIEINCEDRTVLLKTNDDDNNPVNIAGYVDFNSDWFGLSGEYVFSGTNCLIRTVEYNERW